MSASGEVGGDEPAAAGVAEAGSAVGSESAENSVESKGEAEDETSNDLASNPEQPRSSAASSDPLQDTDGPDGVALGGGSNDDEEVELPAAVLAPGELPAGWGRTVEVETGRPVFVNANTNPPTATFFDPRLADAPLPPGWEERPAPTTSDTANAPGAMYYVNKGTGEASWTDPREGLIYEDVYGVAPLKRMDKLELAEALCPLCLELLSEVVTTQCGHNFCKGCITEAVRYQPACPLCRTELSPDVGANPAVNTLLDALLVASFPARMAERRSTAGLFGT